MTFGVNNLINCVNQSSLRSDLTPLEILQLTGSGCQFQTTPVFSVANLSALPSAADNIGRFVFVEDISAYRFSDGVSWSNDFTSVPQNFQAWAWGTGSYGISGDNNTVSKSSPVSVVGGFTDWCQVSAGRFHSLGVRQSGTAWAWGGNGQGRLGDNTTVNKSSPVSVVGGFTDWCQVSAGGFHSLGVRTGGTAWAWGDNGQGKLGDNTIVSKSSPVSVVGGFTDWCQVSAGEAHSLGVRQSGTAWAWGANVQGRLGDDTTVSKSSPVQVVGGFSDWCQIAAGGFHSIGVRQNGTAWAWGGGGSGRLGDNTTIDKSSPVSVVGGFTDWCQISAGCLHSMGTRQNGTAWAWGNNGQGRLGDDSILEKSSPVSVFGGFTDWCQVSAGLNHSLGVRTGSTAWAWGCNGTGQLGDNTTVSKRSPVSVAGGFTDWCQVSAGGSHSLAVRVTKGF